MKSKSLAHVLSILLVAALLCGLFPAAYAEQTREDPADGRTEAAAETPDLSREDTILAFLKLVMRAEAESDPVARAALCREAKERWQEIRISLGLAVYDPETDQNVEDTVRRADQIMYEKKRKLRAER